MSVTNKKKQPTKDGGRPICPHCGSTENKTLNSDRKSYLCVACGEKFTIDGSVR